MRKTKESVQRRKQTNSRIDVLLFGLLFGVVTLCFRALLRSIWIISIVVASNPSDQSFAAWVTQQKAIHKRNNPTISQWFAGLYRKALRIIYHPSLKWTYHNLFLFSIVYVPEVDRYAFGCCGTWRWADTYPTLEAICQWPYWEVISSCLSGMEDYIEINQDKLQLLPNLSTRSLVPLDSVSYRPSKLNYG